ncbi:Alpha/Beta hydrolase protein [Suillus subalutaceus]|uniref:Alpha/Beta hydrolase protein n=1 Tax=Suillus subalutaceus TaxID=48586 RepID=UPI001B85BB30|nr:Alpha/Beta hydrolase protein [Suillus subalutaceus]KAG1877654.1 Alpha/Beta hydrolase protein [Suillus subalutaceus]
MDDYSILQLPDGTQLAYEVLGSDHKPEGASVPLVFVSGTTSCRRDTDKVSSLLAKHRQVLVYDHRGMGDSKARKDDPFTIETLARDLLSLIQHLQWSEVALCGHSMGGIIVQSLLFLPFHRTNPTPLRFRVTHVVLACTAFTPNLDPRYGLKFARRPTGPLTLELIRETVRLSMPPNYDPEWFASEANQERIEEIIDRGLIGRPFRTILQQKRAASQYDFTGFHSRLSPDTQFMIIHGELDQILPFSNVQGFLRLIPWARVVPVGDAPGSVPTFRFGHDWIEYFDPQVWYGVFEVFLQARCREKARL